MNARLLIDHIVRQTTVLIAQLSTSSGVRAPLARVADQVFVQLAREIESQGVSRKVAADMFGIALRTYQRKVQRLTEEAEPDATLWHGVLGYLEEHGPATRAELLDRFGTKDDVVLMSIVNDLVAGGLAYRSGRGDSAILGLVPEADVRRLLEHEEADALEGFVWHSIFKGEHVTEAALAEHFGDGEAVRRALDALIADGRVRRSEHGGSVAYEAGPFLVPVGAPKGWEAAVFDHFQAVTAAIAAKLRVAGPRSALSDVIGGTTMHFGIHDAHPHRDKVLRTLATVRGMLDALLAEVTEYNREHPVDEDRRTRVTFYFGQYVVEPASNSEPNPGK